MLQVARLAPNLLQEAAERVADFFRSQFNTDGGARDRAGKSDLYYTVFALEGLIALRLDPPADRVRPWLETFKDGEGLDLVHLTCLARCWAALPKGSLAAETSGLIARRIGSFRSSDGGYSATPGADRGTVYHGFLALGALQDLDAKPAEPARLAHSIATLQLADGSFANQADVPAGSTPTTAGAVTALRNLGSPVPPGAADWLLERAGPAGGFLAGKEAPLPDLLSTATALHALSGMKVPLGPVRESTLDFVDSLWTGKAFCGNWTDEAQDSEYTWYALLALGHLSLS